MSYSYDQICDLRFGWATEDFQILKWTAVVC